MNHQEALATANVVKSLAKRIEELEAKLSACQQQRAQLLEACRQLIPFVTALQDLSGGQKEAMAIEFARAAIAAVEGE